MRVARHWLKPAAGTGAHRRSARGCVLDDRDHGAQDVLGGSCRGEDRTQGGNRADERKTPRAAAGEATDGDSEVLLETEKEKPQPRTPTLGRPRNEEEAAMRFLIV